MGCYDNFREKKHIKSIKIKEIKEINFICWRLSKHSRLLYTTKLITRTAPKRFKIQDYYECTTLMKTDRFFNLNCVKESSRWG